MTGTALPKEFAALNTRLAEIADLMSAAALVSWDQNTHMPPRSAPARGRQLAALRRVIQEKLADPELGRLLKALEPFENDLPSDDDHAARIRAARTRIGYATRVPADFVARQAEQQATAYQAWVEARGADDFAAVIPHLEKNLELSREYADFFPGYRHIADPLIDAADPGLGAAEVSRIFAELRTELVPLVQAVAAAPPPDDACLFQDFPRQRQVAFAVDQARAFGFDMARGRWDWTAHPFATRIAVDDVRITTRASDGHLGDGLFATLHEAGHGIYNQGTRPAGPVLDGGLGRPGGLSSAVHESQSRLWENVVGRSPGFWQHAYPALQAAFPEALSGVPLETFYRAINKVQPSLIRVRADELTYNLHVMIRFDLELELLTGALAVRDLPEAWRERYRRDLGVEVPDDRDGVLQDVHWYGGRIGGAFQGYTLGNILGAQFYQAALSDHPEIPDEIRTGRFETLFGWLSENIYRHGVRYGPDELVRRITGGGISVQPLLAYLREKYGALYGLEGSA